MVATSLSNNSLGYASAKQSAKDSAKDTTVNTTTTKNNNNNQFSLTRLPRIAS
jgi:hypothetical protein